MLYGHRLSIDLDIFSNVIFESEHIRKGLIKEFGSTLEIRTSSNFGIFCFINNVKVDIIRFPHPLIKPIQLLEGIRMFSKEDIVAMKIQAILGRAKKKDFWDIAELLNEFSISDLITFHEEKFKGQNLFITVPQAITYFSDAEESEDPISLKGQTWDSVKSEISTAVRSYLQ